MLDHHFVLLGAVLSSIGGLTYIRDTLRGKTKPNRVTWFLWALAPLIAFSAQLKEGVGLQATITFTAGFLPLLIFITSFVNRQSYWRLSRFDIPCGIFALLAIVLWRLTGNGSIAIILSIVADFLAGLPTVLKMYHQPDTESYNIFLLGAASSVITLLTLDRFTLALAGFPIYLLLITLLLFSLGRFNGVYKRLLRQN